MKFKEKVKSMSVEFANSNEANIIAWLEDDKSENSGKVIADFVDEHVEDYFIDQDLEDIIYKKNGYTKNSFQKVKSIFENTILETIKIKNY